MPTIARIDDSGVALAAPLIDELASAIIELAGLPSSEHRSSRTDEIGPGDGALSAPSP